MGRILDTWKYLREIYEKKQTLVPSWLLPALINEAERRLQNQPMHLNPRETCGLKERPTSVASWENQLDRRPDWKSTCQERRGKDRM
jgi:hypothetical protein